MDISCKICCSKNLKAINRFGKHKLSRCQECKVVFLSPRPKQTDITFHNLRKYEATQNVKAYFNMRNELTLRAQKSIQVLAKYKSYGQLLDVGCSYGFYLKTFTQNGYRAVGIDISKRAARYVKEKLKLNVIYGRFEDYRFKKESFDIITLFDVFEHFSNPVKILGKIRKILKKDGIVVIQTPNYDSLMSRLTGIDWFWLLIPHHVFLYSPNSLKIFLEKKGFRILKITTWDDFTEIINNILFKLRINNVGKTKLIYTILSKSMTAFSPLSLIWSNLFMGGEILVYAQKKE